MVDVKKITFNSETNQVSSNSYLDNTNVDAGYVQFGIACGFVSTTEITFVHESVVATITAQGKVDFYDSNRNLLASLCIPADKDGRGCYVNVCCKVEDNAIWVRFPQYRWSDNYPYCDGESDRWDAYVTGYKAPLAFSLTTHTLSIVNQ